MIQHAHNRLRRVARIKLRTFWVITSLAGITLIGLIGYASWKAYPILNAWEGHVSAAWGILLAIWGLALAVVGFAVTWLQLLRTKRASDAVKGALVSIKKDYSSFSVTTELRSLQAAIEAASTALNSSHWPEASAAFERIRSATVKIYENNGRLDQAQVDMLKDRALFVNDALDLLTKHRLSKPPDSATNKVISKLRAFHTETLALEIFIWNEIDGN